MVFSKVPLVFSRVDARLPSLRRHRLVLYGDAPDGHAFALGSLDELRVIVRPSLIKLRPQLPAVQHVFVVFHEGGRTPWACEDSKLAARRRRRAFNERDAESPVACDAGR